MLKKFDVKMVNGALVPVDAGLKEYFRSLRNGDYILAIGEKEAFRSLSQNKYYWGVVVDVFAKYTGHSESEMHEIFKAKFNKATKEIAGEIIEYSESTTLMNTQEFNKYIDEIRQWGLELNLYIPEPNEYVEHDS